MNKVVNLWQACTKMKLYWIIQINKYPIKFYIQEFFIIKIESPTKTKQLYNHIIRYIRWLWSPATALHFNFSLITERSKERNRNKMFIMSRFR